MLKSSAEDYVSQIQVGSQIAVRVKPTHPETSVVAVPVLPVSSSSRTLSLLLRCWMARLLFELVGLPLRLIRLGSLFCHADFPSLSRSGMAWASATGQTAITVSRFVRGIFFAKGGDYRRPNAERVSREGTLGWVWRRLRVVAHYCHAITIATLDQSGCSILLKKASSSLMPNRCRAYCFQNCAIVSRHEKRAHRNLYELTRRERARLGSPQSLPCGAAWASRFLDLSPNTALCAASLFIRDEQIRNPLAVVRRAAPFSSQPAPPTELPCYEHLRRC